MKIKRFVLSIIVTMLLIGCNYHEHEPGEYIEPFTILSDDFEDYKVGEYPDTGGWYELWSGTGSDNTYVISGISHNGDKCFMLNGYPDRMRTDGVDLDLTDVEKLTYKFAVMVPSNSTTGAYTGFFVKISPNESENYNAIFFNCEDSLIYIKGTSSTNTNNTWEHDSWYMVKVEIDYNSLLMDVWINDEFVKEDIEAATRDTSNIFSISTEYQPISGNSIVYYDDIEIIIDKIDIIEW